MKTTSEKFDIYQKITDQIIARLEAGVVPWRKPWACKGLAGAPRNFTTGKAYRGMNIWMLAGAPYETPFWLTFNQVKGLGTVKSPTSGKPVDMARVRKGEKGTTIVFWSIIEKKDQVTGETDKRFFLRYSTVFNVEQCDGIPAEKIEALKRKCGIIADPSAPVFSPIETAEAMIKGYDKCAIGYGGDRAFYSCVRDDITLPHKTDFISPENYYSTAFHEIIHSTGHATRLARPGIVDFDRFGSEQYSKEELIAEFGATYLDAMAGIEQPLLEQSASYIAGWISKLKDDPKLIVSAASQAQRAADYVLACCNPDEQQPTDEQLADDVS